MMKTIQTAARQQSKVIALGLAALVVVSGIAVGVPNGSPVQNASAQTAPATFSLSSENPEMVAPGDSFTVTYTIENTGSTSLNSLGLQATEVSNGLNITDISSADATFISSQQNAVGFPTVSPGGNVTVTFTVQTNDTISDERSLSVEASNGFGENEVTQTQNTTVSVTQQSTADAGSDQTVDQGTNVTLNAGNSTDPDGDSLSYSWSQTAGQSTNLSGVTSATPSFTAPAVSSETTLTFQLETTDGNGGIDTDTVNITVQPLTQANFSVENLNAPTTATRGDLLTVSAELSNDGEQAGTQTVEFRVDTDGSGTVEADETLASQEVSLDAGETTEVTFEDLATDALEPGDYTHGVFTANDSETATITISSPPEPANFSVNSLEAPDAATQGDLLTVSAEISNDGEQAGTQTVEFRLDTDGSGTLENNEVLASQNVSLDAGETAEVAFEGLDTSSLAPGDYTHGVVTASDSETATITVSSPPEPANFSVSNLNAPTTATQGDPITISANISNNGEQAGTQTVQFRVDTDASGTLGTDEVLASQNVSLDAGETAEVAFEDLATDALAPREYTHGVVTDNDSETATILIEAANQSPTADAGENQTVDEETSVMLNASGSSDPDGDALTYMWNQTDGPDVTLADADTATPSFTASAVDVETVLSFEVTVSDGNGGTDTDTVDIRIAPAEPPAENQPPVADAGADQTVTEEDTATLDATNSSDPDGDTLSYMWTQTSGPNVTLIDANAATPSFTTPAVEQATDITFEVTVSDGQGGTATDSVTTTVQPVTQDEAFFTVTNLSVPDEVAQGESLNISATITNTGDAEGTQLIEARVDGNRNGTQEVIQTQSVTLAGGESTTITTTRTVPANLSPGIYTGGLFTFDSNQTTSITVVSSAPAEENYTRDEIAQAKYDLNFTDLSNETARQVEELYLRQPFDNGSQPEDVKTREEIAQDRYGEDFEDLSRETTVEIQSDFDAQFGDTGDDAEYTRDEISQAKYYGYNFSELSAETAGQVEELHNRQPFADGLSPSNVQTREEIANQKYGIDVDELSRETRLEVEQTYHQQFNESDTE